MCLQFWFYFHVSTDLWSCFSPPILIYLWSCVSPPVLLLVVLFPLLFSFVCPQLCGSLFSSALRFFCLLRLLVDLSPDIFVRSFSPLLCYTHSSNSVVELLLVGTYASTTPFFSLSLFHGSYLLPAIFLLAYRRLKCSYFYQLSCHFSSYFINLFYYLTC